MKPHELADSIMSQMNFDFNDLHKLSISWNNGKLEYYQLHKVTLGQQQWHDCKTIKDVETKYGNLSHTPHPFNVSKGSVSFAYYIKPCNDIIDLKSEIITGIYNCIKYYEAQLESELEQTKESLKLINKQY